MRKACWAWLFTGLTTLSGGLSGGFSAALFAQTPAELAMPPPTLKIEPLIRQKDETTAETPASLPVSPQPAERLDLRIDRTPAPAKATETPEAIEVAPLAAPIAAPAQPPASPLTVPSDSGLIARPTLQVGDAWAYRRVIPGEPTTLLEQEVTKVSKESIALKSNLRGSNDATIVLYTPEWNLIATSNNSFDPALIHYAYSLYRGKKWRNVVQIRGAEDGQNGTLLVTGEAAAWEEIEVPAGRFRALRIEITLEAPNPELRDKQLRIRETHWLVKEVQRPVKLVIETSVPGQPMRIETVDLMAYRLAE